MSPATPSMNAAALSTPAVADLRHPELVPAILAVAAAVFLCWIVVSLSQWRRISWRDHLDAPVSLAPKAAARSAHWTAWKVFAYHEEVAEPSLVLLRVRNSGLRTIGEADIRRPITITFPGRQVREVTVTDCHGVTREMIAPLGQSDGHVIDNRITLPRFPLRHHASFNLLILLSGTDRGVHVKARIRRGRMVRESRGRGRVARNLMFGTALALLAGTQAGVTFSQAAAVPSMCAAGHLTLEGSTAFAPVARQIGAAYAASCPDATFTVSAIATFNGLNALASSATSQPATTARQATTTATGQIAMSDGPAPAGYQALTGHPVAVIIFAVVVNRSDGVFNLSVAQLRDIFDGRVTNWRELGGADLPVRIVARVAGSGTRRAFDTTILGGKAEPAFSSYNCVTKNAVPSSAVTKCEVTDTGTLLERVNAIPGAIGYAQISDAASYQNVERVTIGGADADFGAVQGREYPFWTVEYLYTYGTPPRGSLASAFLSYLGTDTAKDILRSQAYTPCVDRGQTLTATLCSPAQS